MPKAILEFDLPEEAQEHNTAVRGVVYLAVLEDFDNYLRNKIKYGESVPEQEKVVIQNIRDTFHEFLKDRNVELFNE